MRLYIEMMETMGVKQFVAHRRKPLRGLMRLDKVVMERI